MVLVARQLIAFGRLKPNSDATTTRWTGCVARQLIAFCFVKSCQVWDGRMREGATVRGWADGWIGLGVGYQSRVHGRKGRREAAGGPLALCDAQSHKGNATPGVLISKRATTTECAGKGRGLAVKQKEATPKVREDWRRSRHQPRTKAIRQGA